MTEREKLFEEAETLGLKFKKNISSNDLKELIIEAKDKKEDEEIKAKEATYEKPVKEEEVETEVITEKKPKVSPGQARINALNLKRVIITPLEPSKQEVQAEIFSIGTGATGFIKRAVKFNEEVLVPVPIIRHIKGKQMSATKGRPTKLGMVQETISVPAYNVQVLPDFTEEELRERGIID